MTSMETSTPSISVMIPVYGSSSSLDDTLRCLVEDDYPRKEIVVVLDLPTLDSLSLSKKYSKSVTFDISAKRRGKVESLKRACSLAKGDTYLFLDSDVAVHGDHLLSKVASEIGLSEMIELKKTVARDTAMSKLVYFEYLGIGAVDWMISSRIKRCFGLNGAAFAIRKDIFERVGGFKNVLSEDLDLGLRSYIAGVKFKYCYDIEVGTFAPRNLTAWLKQRKRWSYGTALWAKDNWKTLLKLLRREPSLCLPALFLIFPALLVFVSSFAFNGLAQYDALALLLLFLPVRGFPVVAIPFFTFSEMSSLFALSVIMLIGMTACGVVYYYFGKKLGFGFSIRWFPLYYLLYSPVWFAAMLWGISQVFIRRDPVKVDWVIQD